MEIEETIGDYRRFGGLLWPCLFVSGPKGAADRARLEIENMEINPALDESLFRMPAK